MPSWTREQLALVAPLQLSLAAGGSAGAPWLVWGVMLLAMRRMSGGVYHPPVGAVPLSKRRQWLVLLLGLVFLLIFTPVPLRQSPSP
jgi:hypothetical protein